MKNFLLLASLSLAHSVFAREEYAQVAIDWKARELSETVVLMCDDTYYQGVEVTIPGHFAGSIESYIHYTDCDASVKITKKTKFVENGIQKTKIRIKNDASCTLDIYNTQTEQKFELYIADAC